MTREANNNFQFVKVVNIKNFHYIIEKDVKYYVDKRKVREYIPNKFKPVAYIRNTVK